MFLTIVFIGIALVLVMLLLPYASGLTKIEIDTTHHHRHQQKSQQRQQSPSTATSSSQQYGYIPPDEIQPESADSEEHGYLKDRAHALKEKLQVTSEDMPLKIKLNKFDNSDAALRHRKKEKLDMDTNPNNYDYDIDELIAEETEISRKDQQAQFYKNQVIGKEKEEMV
ncbi:hypothetical protein Cantr_05831 [Candida viswanathii]|uniref:Uncharacterized protein n=1 Tax=Candida viswanathii TaxID=5486 RepID=A0A367XSR8_9ASCO|nr:hypothetical protein Cantr_05831 [Candida viswanathii]